MLKMILKFAEERVTLKTKKKVTASFYLFMSVICKFEEYIIKIGLKANLDRLVVMHAILMIWNLKRKQIVTCLFFFFKIRSAYYNHSSTKFKNASIFKTHIIYRN